MSKKDNLFIPVNGTNISVSKEVYDAYYRPIWKNRTKAQRNGECYNTKAESYKCNGECHNCPFYAATRKVSINTPIGDGDDNLTLEDTLAYDDAPSVESIVISNELLNALHKAISQLAPEDRRILELTIQDKTEREMAKLTGKGKTAIHYKKEKVLSILREALADFI